MLQACVAGGQIDIEGFWGLTSCGDVTLRQIDLWTRYSIDFKGKKKYI
jgi:hypothetical protein